MDSGRLKREDTESISAFSVSMGKAPSSLNLIINIKKWENVKVSNPSRITLEIIVYFHLAFPSLTRTDRVGITVINQDVVVQEKKYQKKIYLNHSFFILNSQLLFSVEKFLKNDEGN